MLFTTFCISIILVCAALDQPSHRWCYTTDPAVLLDYCNVPYCDDELEDLGGDEPIFFDDCGTMSDLQRDYRGNISITASGKTCQRWDAQTPHAHTRGSDRFPERGQVENFCRNPDNEDGA